MTAAKLSLLLLPYIGTAIADDRTNAFRFGFEPNAGQAAEAVKFIARGANYTVFLQAGEISFRSGNSVLKMSFVGANPHAELTGIDPLNIPVHYLIGEPQNWRLHAPMYGRLEYRNLYPSIDLIFYGDSTGRLEYDLVLRPHAEPSQIRLRFEGAERMEAAPNGDIRLRTPMGEWRHSEPKIFQMPKHGRQNIAGRFLLRGPDEAGFEIGTYDRSLPLTIDPTLTFSTYLGGNGQDSSTSIALDAGGNAYVTGWTESLDFPEKTGSWLGSPSRVDAYVTKLSAAGTPLYISYLGGSGDDRGYGIAVDSSGSAIVAGWTYSSNFPAVNASQPKWGGGRDGFVAKLNPAGTGLVFSTYLGGSAADSANAVTLDAQSNIYVAGETASAGFPVLNGFQGALAGGQDAFVAKFNNTGTKLYSTYLGGMGDDRATAVAADASGNAYITGSTYSPNFPVLNAFQAQLGGGQDAFASKISPAGNALVYSTYLGGSGGGVSAPEAGNGIAVDSTGAAYIAGTTSSLNFPTAQPLQSARAGSQDAFVLKLAAAGNALAYGTYLGGSSIDIATSLAIDNSGRAYVAGYTASTDFPIANAVQTANMGGYEAFIVRLNASGVLEMGTYLGGTGSDGAYGIAVDASGNIYAAGQTGSTNFPTANAAQTFPGAALSASIFKLSATVSATAAFVKLDTTTQGTWKGSYGADGWAIPNDSTNYPAYAQVTPASQFIPLPTWAPSTSDVRALQKAASSDRIAALWGAWSSFTIDVNLTPGTTHQVALYCLDWDSTTRSQRIDVLDAGSGTVLDSRTASGFNAGQYLAWNVSGHVTFQITKLGASNVVISGIFFGAAPLSTATFLKQDSTTQGTWKGVYGADGWAIPNDSTNYPAYAQVAPASQFIPLPTWAPSTSDVRALQKATGSDRIAALWGAWSSFTIDVNLAPGATHQVALYCLDWDSTTRSQRIDVLDAGSGTVLDSRTVSAFHNGQYLVWNVSGHVTFRTTLLGSSNVVISGIFFGAAPLSTAAFVKQDTATQGTWKGVYGADGWAIPNDSTSYPTYAQVTVASQFIPLPTWAPSTSDVRALQKAASSDRIAALWGAWSSFTIDVNLTPGASHQLALYCVDWDSATRSQRIDMLDANSGTVLDTRTVSGFHNGQYLVWNTSGHVMIRITTLAGANAVISGIFFR